MALTVYLVRLGRRATKNLKNLAADHKEEAVIVLVRLRQQREGHEVAVAIVRLKGKMTICTQPQVCERLVELLHEQIARFGLIM